MLFTGERYALMSEEMTNMLRKGHHVTRWSPHKLDDLEVDDIMSLLLSGKLCSLNRYVYRKRCSTSKSGVNGPFLGQGGWKRTN